MKRAETANDLPPTKRLPYRHKRRAVRYIYDFPKVLLWRPAKKSTEMDAIELASSVQALYIRPPVTQALEYFDPEAPSFLTRFIALPPEWRNW